MDENNLTYSSDGAGNSILSIIFHHFLLLFRRYLNFILSNDNNVIVNLFSYLFSYLLGNLKPHRRSVRLSSDEIIEDTARFGEEDALTGRRRKVRTTAKGSVVVVNEFASELLYLMRTATDMLV